MRRPNQFQRLAVIPSGATTIVLGLRPDGRTCWSVPDFSGPALRRLVGQREALVALLAYLLGHAEEVAGG